MREVLPVLAVIVTMLTAGCTIPGSEPVGGASISYYGSMNQTDSGFEMRGELAIDGGIPQQDSFEDTTIYLCTGDREVFQTKSIGTIRDGERKTVSVISNQSPYYVVFNSPDFWEERDIDVQYYQWIEEEGVYGVHQVTRQDELPCGQGE